MRKIDNNHSSTKVFSYGGQVQPTRDWLVLVSITIVLLILSVGWNVWLFSQVENGKILGSAGPTTSAPSAESSVNAVQSLFQKRAAEENHYQTDYHFVDPSLPGS